MLLKAKPIDKENGRGFWSPLQASLHLASFKLADVG